MVQTPRSASDPAVAAIRRCDALNVSVLAGGTSGGEPIDLVIAHVSNTRLGDLLDGLDGLDVVSVSFLPHGVIALQPPAADAPAQVTDVTLKSPIEIFLSGLQSIGSWRGFLGYAASAGALVWIGLLTGTVYLLIAAMLIAPFAGPAMNAAIGATAGHPELLRRSLVRYASGLATAIMVALLLTLVFGPDTPTELMVDVSQLSSLAVLVPIVAGAAGALHLSQSERHSLVSGAAVGLLVAASLAPPAGVIGMGAAIGRFDLAANGLFVLVLQLAAINLAAVLTFRALGMRGPGTRYPVRSRLAAPLVTGASALGVAGLLALQLALPVELNRSSLAQRASSAVREMLRAHPEVVLVHADARFVRSEGPGEHPLLVEILVTPRGEEPTEAAFPELGDLERRLARDVQALLDRRWPAVTPVVRASVLAPPMEESSRRVAPPTPD